jgi:hypothetical protein
VIGLYDRNIVRPFQKQYSEGLILKINRGKLKMYADFYIIVKNKVAPLLN